MRERRRRRTSALTDRVAQILQAHTALEAARVEYRAVTGAPPPPILMADALRAALPDASLAERMATAAAVVRTVARTFAADPATRAATVAVADHGAVGDGATDDTAAIQAAVDAAVSRTTGREGITHRVRLAAAVWSGGDDGFARLAEAVGVAVGSVGHDAHVVRHHTPSDPTCWGPGPDEVGCGAEGVDTLGLCRPCRAAIEARTPTGEG